MLFSFELKPPAECALTISWFYLTDSLYYIDLGKIRLFENTPKMCEKYNLNSPFLDYQYSRLLDDLFDILPRIACPMPKELYNQIDTEEKRDILWDKLADIYDNFPYISESELDDVYESLRINIFIYGMLDSTYLRYRSKCDFFHIGDKIIIQYDFLDKDEDGDTVWTAGKGIHTMLYTEFVDEVESLCNRFFKAMDKQVENMLSILKEDELEKSKLLVEHTDRKKYYYNILKSVKNNEYNRFIDWKQIQSNLDKYVNNIPK